MYHALHVSYVESRALQTNSCDNLNKGYGKLGQVKGDYSGRERANSYAPPDTRAQNVIRVWISPGALDLNPRGTRVCKARFQGAASPCSRWPIASFTLPGLTHAVRLNPVYPCILGLRNVMNPSPRVM